MPIDTKSGLDEPVTAEGLRDLLSRGLLSDDAARRAFTFAPSHSWGHQWASRILWLFGVALCLAGVVFFFAFNWDAVPPLGKLGMIEVGLVSCVAGALLQRTSQAIRGALLLAAGVLVGVFFAVFGQIYQTGADAWELFAVWALLLLPFAGLARMQGGWVLFSVIASTALVLFFEQTFDLGVVAQHLLPNSVALVWGGVWLGLELTSQRRSPAWLNGMWSRGVFATFVFAPLVLPELHVFEDHHLTIRVVQYLILGSASAVVFVRFARREVDIAVLAITSVAWLALIVARAGLFFSSVIGDGIGFAFVMTAFVTATTGGLVTALRAVSAGAGTDR